MQGQGPKNWVRLDLDPAIYRLLEQYAAIISKKSKRRSSYEISIGKLVSAIVVQFLLPQRDRIQDEYQELLLWAARDLVRNSFGPGELEASELSKVPYVPRTASDRTRIPGVKRDRKNPRPIRIPASERSSNTVEGCGGKPREISRESSVSTNGDNSGEDSNKAI